MNDKFINKSFWIITFLSIYLSIYLSVCTRALMWMYLNKFSCTSNYLNDKDNARQFEFLYLWKHQAQTIGRTYSGEKHIYIYRGIQREREREREGRERERERERKHRERERERY